jgi:hypothetical protein
MKNSEKYRTAPTRERAFKSFCHKHNCFEGCPVIKKIKKTYKKKVLRCSFVWLDLEAENDKE